MAKRKVIGVNLKSGRQYLDGDIRDVKKTMIEVWDSNHNSSYWVKAENVQWK